MSSLATQTVEKNLLSEQTVNLNPRERLKLLLQSKSYPIATKRSSAKKQIEEMIDLYNLCSIVLARYFPDENADGNFIMLNFLFAMREPTRSLVNQELGKTFAMLDGYEKWEKRITDIQALFLKYSKNYPDLYEKYNLEDMVNESISSIVWNSREMLQDDNDFIFEVFKRWGLT